MTNPTRTNHEYESSKVETINGPELRSFKIGKLRLNAYTNY